MDTNAEIADTAAPPPSRYESIRKYIAAAHKRNGELPAETYLLAQVALLLCDIQELMEEQRVYLHEMAVHGVKVVK